ncbi:MAG: hypothetical protein K0Q90_1734 [Paenibacillaceae bacterium]|jgi:ABC-2 type transport system permease protein|nr:hypothetical protein [Paenibacillaceae bacterium]
MNVFLRELKAYRKSLLIWCICMALLILSGMGKYTAYSSGGAGSQALADLPQTLKSLLGMGSFDITTMSGFYALLFLYIEIAAGIHAVLLGSGILAKEERDKTTEFLMTRPLSRTAVVCAKLGAALVNIVVLNAVSLTASLAVVSAYNKGPDVSGEVAVFVLSMLFVQLIFLTFGMLLAAVWKNAKTSGSMSAGMLLAAFVIYEFTELNPDLRVLNVLSPFKYFSYGDMAEGSGLSPVIAAASLLLSAAFAWGTIYFYRKRDLGV